MEIKTTPVTLKNAFMITPNVKHFVFECPDPNLLAFSPGQFITMHFPHESKPLRRSYSIANVPGQNNHIEFAAGYVEKGPGSELLFHLQPGDTIHINGPFGRLTLKDEVPQRYIFIATSTGITPYRSMMEVLKKRLIDYPNLEIVILQGVATQKDVLYPDDFLSFADYSPRVTFRVQLSRETNADLSAHEYHGRVQTAFPEIAFNPEHDMVYLCGNPGMIDDSFEYLKTLGFTTQHIIREKYISR